MRATALDRCGRARRSPYTPPAHTDRRFALAAAQRAACQHGASHARRVRRATRVPGVPPVPGAMFRTGHSAPTGRVILPALSRAGLLLVCAACATTTRLDH